MKIKLLFTQQKIDCFVFESLVKKLSFYFAKKTYSTCHFKLVSPVGHLFLAIAAALFA